MGWQDRDYYRDSTSPEFASDPLRWLMYGRIRLFRTMGVTVYAHSSLIVVGILVLLLGTGIGKTFGERFLFLAVLFGVVLLHEFGHIFGARATGGSGEEIVMTPLGGLAMALARRRPWPTFVTVAAGPAVNVVICIICGIILGLTTGIVPLGPYSFGEARPDAAWISVGFYAYYVYLVSYFLLLFNLLPVYPLDGGQLLQSILWPKFGWYKSMLWTVTFGPFGAGAMILYGIVTLWSGLLVLLIGASCLANCLQMRRLLLAEGPWAFQEEDEPDWQKSVFMDPDEPEKVGLLERRRQAKAARRAEAEAAAVAAREAQLDAILAKIGRSGRDSLTGREKRILEEATRARRTRS